jgi:hypothetical protein
VNPLEHLHSARGQQSRGIFTVRQRQQVGLNFFDFAMNDAVEWNDLSALEEGLGLFDKRTP